MEFLGDMLKKNPPLICSFRQNFTDFSGSSFSVGVNNSAHFRWRETSRLTPPLPQLANSGLTLWVRNVAQVMLAHLHLPGGLQVIKYMQYIPVRSVLLFKGTVSRELRHRLLYIIGKLFSRPIVALLKIYILLKGHFTIFKKPSSVSKAGSNRLPTCMFPGNYFSQKAFPQVITSRNQISMRYVPLMKKTGNMCYNTMEERLSSGSKYLRKCFLPDVMART